MRIKMRIVLLVMSLAAGASISGTAAASTVTVSPGGAVTGTAGTAQWVLNTARRTLNCTTSGFTGTLASNSGTPPLAVSTDIQMRFSGCRMTGGVNYTFTCMSTSSLTAMSATASGSTPMSLTGIFCVEAVSATCRVNVSGSLPMSFNNSGSTLALLTAGQRLAATGSTCTILPNDTSVTLSDATGNALYYYVSPATTITMI